MLKDLVRRALPDPLLWNLRNARTYCRRLLQCAEVAHTIRGVSEQDREIVWEAVRRSPIDLLNRLTEWREVQLIAEAQVVARGLGQFVIRAHSDDLHHILPSSNGRMMRVIASQLGPGDIAIDAGASIGAVTVFMARRVGGRGRVIAFEMMPDTASVLRRNVGLNHATSVEVVEMALSDVPDTTTRARVVPGLFGQASISSSSNPARAVREVVVPTTTLDRVTEDINSIAVLKMDLEGAEVKALAGGQRTLTKTRSVIFESWEPGGGETGAMLAERGFKISPIDGRNFLALRPLAGVGGSIALGSTP